MKKRQRIKIIKNYINNCDLWINPETSTTIYIPKSGKTWSLFIRACNKKPYNKILVNVIKAYYNYFCDIEKDKESEDFKNFERNTKRLINTFDY